MIDLFGLRKDPAVIDAAVKDTAVKDTAVKDTEAVNAAETPASPEASGTRGQQKLWAVLLVIDSIFVIVFGGAVAAKIYKHWMIPQKSPNLSSKKLKPPEPPPPAAVETPKTPDIPVPAKPPEPPKEPQTAKAPPVAKAGGGAKPSPLAKPSLLTEAPKRREAPEPQSASGGKAASNAARNDSPAPAAKAAAPPPVAKAAAPVKATEAPAAPAASQKAAPFEFKIEAPGAKSVQLAGAFIRRDGLKNMVDRGGGLWTLTLYLTPNTYRYTFLVDGKKTLDPKNGQTDRGASVISIP